MKNSELKPGKLYITVVMITFFGPTNRSSYLESGTTVMFLGIEDMNYEYYEYDEYRKHKCHYLIEHKKYYNWMSTKNYKNDSGWFRELP